MAFSFFILLFIYYPIIVMYLFPPHLPSNIHELPFAIEISKIHIYAPIIPNVDSYNESQYREVLHHGIALAKGTTIPGSPYFFAHSSDYPWDLTRYNTIFFRLNELKKGDEILIAKDKQVFHYKVFDKKVIWPDDIHYLIDSIKNSNLSNQPQITQIPQNQGIQSELNQGIKRGSNHGGLILQTCWPLGTSLQRLLIFAKPV